MANKSPFKMWGSWIGAFLGIFAFPIYLSIWINYLCHSSLCGEAGIAFVGTPFTWIFTVPIGFLLGLGIETLIRKNKWFGLK